MSTNNAPDDTECPHGCGERSWCTLCTACDRTAARRAARPIAGTARADALYLPQSARWQDRRPAPRHMWTGRSRGPVAVIR